MTNRKPFPILSALRREQDTFTLNALGLWRIEYQDVAPQVAANDNDAEDRPIDPEVVRREHTAEELIAAYRADEANQGEPGYKRQYSAAMHRGTHKPDIRQAKKSPPPPEDIDAESEMVRHIEAKSMREWLGAGAEILDMAIGPYTYRDIGRHIGICGSDDTLERRGKREVKDTANIFWNRAA